MANDRGAYRPLADVDDQGALGTPRSRKYTFITNAPASRIFVRVAVFLTAAGLVLLGFRHFPEDASSQRGPYELAASHLKHLASPLDAHKIVYSKTNTAYVVGEHHNVSGRYPADYRWVDPYSREPFVEVMKTNGMNNNAMARMPAGSPYDMMVVARGANDVYHDETEGINYVNLTLVGFFVNYEPKSGAWIRTGPEPYILDIPIWRQFPRPCSNLVNGGPADPRLIWSDAGEPLAIIGTSSRASGVCKAVGLADLRAVWPGLRQHLDSIGYGDVPIRFTRFTEIGMVGERAPYEKNWAAFFPGPKPAVAISEVMSRSSRWMTSKLQRGPSVWPHFLTRIRDRTIVQVDEGQLVAERMRGSYVLSKPMDLAIAGGADDTSEATSACIINSLPEDWSSGRLHLATPFYRVTFCPRETCEPTRQNTVLLGLIHYKLSRRTYRRMFVTMKVDAPFEIISVSPSLHFGSAEIDEDVVFSVSLAFLPSKKTSSAPDESPFSPSQDAAGGWLAHGWLDDTLVVGAGLRDAEYDAIHLPVATALQGHTLCS